MISTSLYSCLYQYALNAHTIKSFIAYYIFLLYQVFLLTHFCCQICSLTLHIWWSVQTSFLSSFLTSFAFETHPSLPYNIHSEREKKTFIANNSCNSLNLSNVYLLCLLYFPNNHLSYNYISTAKAINSSEPSRHLRENIFGAPMYLWYTKLTFSLSLPVVPLYF